MRKKIHIGKCKVPGCGFTYRHPYKGQVKAVMWQHFDENHAEYSEEEVKE